MHYKGLLLVLYSCTFTQVGCYSAILVLFAGVIQLFFSFKLIGVIQHTERWFRGPYGGCLLSLVNSMKDVYCYGDTVGALTQWVLLIHLSVLIYHDKYYLSSNEPLFLGLIQSDWCYSVHETLFPGT